MATAEQARSLARKPFSVHGPLPEMWASRTTARPKDKASDSWAYPRNADVSFHREVRSNTLLRSVMALEVRMARTSLNTASILVSQARPLVDNRHGLVVNTMVSSAGGRTEVDDALFCCRGSR